MPNTAALSVFRLVSGHAFGLFAGILWLLGQLIPFVSGSKNLLIASPSRSYNMPKFITYLFNEGQAVVGALLLLFLVAAPLVLFVRMAVGGGGAGSCRRRAIGAWILVAVDLVCLLAIRAGVDEKATPHLMPGFWLLLAGLFLAALAASRDWLSPKRHGAQPGPQPGVGAGA